MKTIFKLTAINIKGEFTVEEVYFTSKTKALKSFDKLQTYLNNNHNLNVNNKEIYSNYERIRTVILDNSFSVSLVEHNIKSMILQY